MTILFNYPVIKYQDLSNSDKLELCGYTTIFELSHGHWGDIIEHEFRCNSPKCVRCNPELGVNNNDNPDTGV